MQMDVHKTPFYTTKEMPHVTVSITKRRFFRSNSQVQARHQDVAAGGAKNQKGGTFLRCSIGCMQQPVGQT